MTEFDEIMSKKGQEKKDRLIEYYSDKVNIESWLNNNISNCIINFKDRIEYKKNNMYHRLNGPAIDYKNDEKDKYYFKGELFEKEYWKKIVTKELRRIKLKKLNIISEENKD